MQFHLKNIKEEKIGKVVNALIILGCVDIQIVNNTHLEAGGWEISFINYIITPENNKKPLKTKEAVWREVMEEIHNG